jgi:hypothetical protein
VVEPARPAVERWAAERRLSFAAEAEPLPPATAQLRHGLGVGSQRSLLQRLDGPLGSVVHDQLATRPERASRNVCAGILPGGLGGRLAHHVHLRDRGAGENRTRWLAVVDTVVVATLPSGSRAAFTLTAAPAVGDGGGIALGRRDPGASPDPLADVVPIPPSTHEADGVRWVAWPAETAADLRAIAGPRVRRAFAAAPAGTRVELELGELCVLAPGRAIDDPAVLDALCHLAAEIALAVAAVDRGRPALDPAVPLSAPPDSPRERWVAAGAALVDWPRPPTGVTTAQAAYRPVVARAAGRRGRLAGGIAGGTLALLSVAGAAIWAAGWLLFGDAPEAFAGAALMLALGLLGAWRAGRRAARDQGADRARTATAAWGLEAFARGYATGRRLRQEDPDELRRRLPPTVRGRPQKAWHGDLGDATPGHLALWIEPTLPGAPTRHWLVAAISAAGLDPATVEAAAGEDRRVTLAAGLCTIAEPVAADGRTAERLDALRSVAARVAAGAAAPVASG